MARKTADYGGRWKPLKALTEGGQAQIFLVEDKTGAYQEPCVLKRVLNPARHERFRNEVEAVKTLSHPNISQGHRHFGQPNSTRAGWHLAHPSDSRS